MKRDIKKLPKWAQSHFKHLAEMKEFAVEQYNVVLELNKKAVSEIKKCYAEIADKDALIVELSTSLGACCASCRFKTPEAEIPEECLACNDLSNWIDVSDK